MHSLPPQCAAAIERANQLIVDESAATIKRILSLADGDLCDIGQVGKRIYYRAPDIVSIEYVINRALGTPGARPIIGETRTGNDIEDALSDIAHELQHLPAEADPLDPEGPLRAILGAVAKRRAEYKQQQAVLEQRVIEFLPTAIERLTELCAGVIVHKEHNGKTRRYTLRPNRRAIEHISHRIQGSSKSIVDSLDGTSAPDLTREYSPEDLQKMTTTQLIALLTAAEAHEKQAPPPLPLPARNERSGEGRGEGYNAGGEGCIDLKKEASNRHPSPVYGEKCNSFGADCAAMSNLERSDALGGPGSGDEGCSSGDEAYVELPSYYTAACLQMAEFLPTAIAHMKTLAQGATTIVETDTGDRVEINHLPDSRANQFMINLFIGAPTSRFIIKDQAPTDLTPNAEPIAHYTDAIVKLCTANPAHANHEAHIRTLLQQLTETI